MGANEITTADESLVGDTSVVLRTPGSILRLNQVVSKMIEIIQMVEKLMDQIVLSDNCMIPVST